MYRFLLRPKWIGFHLLCVTGIVGMVSAGVWQLHRNDQRHRFEQEVRDRTNAAETLAKAPLNRGQLLELAATVRSLGALELPRVLAAYERNADEEVARRVLAAVEIGRAHV